MYKVAFAPFGFVANAGASRLESFAVRAGGNLFESIGGGQPDLEVIGFRGGETQVGSAKLNHTVMETQALQDGFRVAYQRLKFVVARLRPREFEQLNLLELMLPRDAARVLARRAGLRAEASRPGADLDGQRVGIDSLVAVEVVQLNFGGGRQPQVGALEMEHVRCKFGQVSRTGERGAIGGERREDLRVAMLLRVRVQKEVGQCAFQARARANIKRKPRASDLHRRRQVQDAGALADLPVRPRRKAELRRRSPATHFDVVLLTLAHRHRGVRQVGNREQELARALVKLRDMLVVLLDLLGDALHLRDESGSILAGLFPPRDLLAGFVALGLEPLGRCDQLAALAIERPKPLQVQSDTAVTRHLLE